MKRKELILELEHTKKPTPNTEQATKAVAEATKADAKLITIKSVTNDFGSNKAKIKAFIYENEKAKNAAEKVNKKKLLEAEKKAKEEAKKKEAEAKAPEETKPEAKEEPKEEKKEEPAEQPKQEEKPKQ